MRWKTGECLAVEDWRWRLLLGLALLLLATGALRNHFFRPPAPRISGGTPQCWRELDLRWEPEGALGQGIYSRGGQEISSAVIPAVGQVDAATLVEPRLAVLTFRPLDLNRVDFDTLRVLKGVGPKMAAAIIAHRLNHGSFQSIDELLEVKGVGPAKLNNLRRNLAVHAVAAP